MISPPFRVGKFFLDGCTLYGLWFNDEHLGYFNSFEECQEEAERHRKDNDQIQGAEPLAAKAPSGMPG